MPCTGDDESRKGLLGVSINQPGTCDYCRQRTSEMASKPYAFLHDTQAMEADRLERDSRLAMCREFYFGIKQWLDERGGRVKKSASKRPRTNANSSLSGFGSPLSPASQPPCRLPKLNSASGSRFPSRAGEQEPDILEVIQSSFVNMERRLATKIDTLADRVNNLEGVFHSALADVKTPRKTSKSSKS
ncbi:hypothetical protein DIPPA_27584 [Diplonema papillatum]|nr:hypothetical protein DIPPA_27584 [Diplonema papillatum]